MKCVDICVTARSGGNGRPITGEATFDDGKTYDWSHYSGGPEEIRFQTGKQMPHGGIERTSFASARRAAALFGALNGEDPDVVIEDQHIRDLRPAPEPDLDEDLPSP